MDTEKQRQHRCDGVRLTESGNARTEQLLVVPTELLTNREWLPGELLNGSERQRPGWFSDMKYQTCYTCNVQEIFLHSSKWQLHSYSDLVDTWADSVCIHQLILKMCSRLPV